MSQAPKPDRWFAYDGESEALLKQWKDVKLKILDSNGAIAQCLGSNGQYYGSVPVHNLIEVAAPHIQTQTAAIAPQPKTETLPLPIAKPPVDRPQVKRQAAGKRSQKVDRAAAEQAALF